MEIRELIDHARSSLQQYILTTFGAVNRNYNEFKPMLIAIIAIGCVSVLLSIAILINQRKIKKQLKQLLEEKERNTND